MNLIFYILNLVAILSSLCVITYVNPVRALVFLIIFLISISCMFFLLGAEFAGAIEVIIYAGAITSIFIFVIMTLNIDKITSKNEFIFLYKNMNLFIPLFFSIVLLIILLFNIFNTKFQIYDISKVNNVTTKDISIALFNQYAVIVELSSLLLLSGIVIAIFFNYKDFKKI